jgi:hypothetical protein
MKQQRKPLFAALTRRQVEVPASRELVILPPLTSVADSPEWGPVPDDVLRDWNDLDRLLVETRENCRVMLDSIGDQSAPVAVRAEIAETFCRDVLAPRVLSARWLSTPMGEEIKALLFEPWPWFPSLLRWGAELPASRYDLDSYLSEQGGAALLS